MQTIMGAISLASMGWIVVLLSSGPEIVRTCLYGEYVFVIANIAFQKVGLIVMSQLYPV